MKFQTFINIYYNHRLEKSNFLKKIYIYLILPFTYLLEKTNIQKIINLDIIKLEKKNYSKKI